MPDFLDQKRQEIADRLKELTPAVEEYRLLEAAASALEDAGQTAATAVAPTPKRRGPGRPPGSVSRKGTSGSGPAKPRKKAGPSTSRGGRRKGSGPRAAEALSVVRSQPGITIPELAAKMGIKQNYLYRVLPSLEQQKKVTKKGRGWHPNK